MRKSDEAFQKALRQLGLAPSDKVLIAYSGGGDSALLLHLALAYFDPKAIHVAYVDYHDSPWADEEEAIVTKTLRELPVIFHRKDVHLDWKSPNFEDTARTIRYAFFKKIVRAYGLKGVLTGHQQKDDAETYLFQKQRKGLVSYLGLAPISTVASIAVYRPLLTFAKPFVQEELKALNIDYFEDPTNQNPNRFRDRIRAGLTQPDVESILAERDHRLSGYLANRAIAADLAKNPVIAWKDYDALSDDNKEVFWHAWAKRVLPDGDSAALSALSNLGLEYVKSHRSGCIQWMPGIYLYKSADAFYPGEPLPLEIDFSYRIDKPGTYEFPWATLKLPDPVASGFGLCFPLVLRPVRKGDLIQSRLISKDPFDFMKKAKVPVYLKGRYPALVTSKNRIVFIPRFSLKDLKILSPRFPKPYLA